jgi:hypothetical protein
MKKFLLALCTGLFLVAFNSCEKTDTNNGSGPLCHDGKLNGGEQEIDCGGGCGPCPDPGTLTCKLGTSEYIASVTLGQILGPNIRVYGNDYRNNRTRPLMFMFVPGQLNTEIPIGAVSFAYNGEAYIMEAGDSGKVVITALDTTRKIISGTFWFSGNRTTGRDTATAREGVFTNIRYNN